MSWFLSPALATLRKQANHVAPNRSKISDGTIGDAAHSARTSDHNPRADGEVCAIDITHDPASGMDAHKLARQLAASGDKRIKYIISAGRIWSTTRKDEGWRNYSGSNQHHQHAHVSVRPDQSAALWVAPMFGSPAMPSQPSTSERLFMDPADRKILREEIERGSNRTIGFLTAVIADAEKLTRDGLAKWTKAMSDLTVEQIKKLKGDE